MSQQRIGLQEGAHTFFGVYVAGAACRWPVLSCSGGVDGWIHGRCSKWGVAGVELWWW